MRIKDDPHLQQKPKPLTLQGTDKVQKAIDVMCDNKIGSIIITDKNDKVTGILTERDMLNRVLKPKVDVKKTAISKVMTRDVRVANENDDLANWMQAMSEERFRRLPIVDEDGRLVNVMSQGDFVAHTFPDVYEKIRQDLKSHIGRHLQLALIVLGVLVLGMIALNY